MLIWMQMVSVSGSVFAGPCQAVTCYITCFWSGGSFTALVWAPSVSVGFAAPPWSNTTMVTTIDNRIGIPNTNAETSWRIVSASFTLYTVHVYSGHHDYFPLFFDFWGSAVDRLHLLNSRQTSTLAEVETCWGWCVLAFQCQQFWWYSV